MERLARLTALLDLVTERGSVRVDELVQELGVSPATVRRDLDHLAAQQLLQRTRGGAAPNPSSTNLPFRYKIADRDDPLLRIAERAAQLVEPGAVVGVNGGRTTTEVARMVATRQELVDSDERHQVVVVTNAVNIANELAIRRNLRLVLTGGVVRAMSYELIGPLAARVLDDVSIDVLFLGVNAIDAGGAYTHHDGEAEINALLVKSSAKVVVVAASAKLKARSFVRICHLNQVDLVITDVDADPERVEQLVAAGVEVQLV
ncbi:DeoR/GlpR family DNA-binding transcription regulator [Scrofimicrobium sp. R131]|uniref:DeoR/GlpR family DNA-binding transcription regulator n=1 Tax=Scrofimicrobium appendicitidis TaxID=3079930 RepID=A0AAU7V6Z5_9ACTO